jgi:hypothetical protein
MRPWIALSALALGACAAETSSPAVADHFEVVQSPTTGTPGRLLDSLILVRLVDDRGGAVAGADVSWSVVDGGGVITPAATTTGEDGIVAAQWRLGIGSETQSLNLASVGVSSIKVRVEAKAFRAIAIAQGDGFGCGIDPLGDAWCWGEVGNTYPPQPQYGPVPVRADSGHTLIGIVASAFHACAWSSSTTYCWGFPNYLGRGAGGTAFLPSAPISGGHQFTKLVAGNYATCGLDPSGQIWCWGVDNGQGNLGNPAGVQQIALVPQAVVQSGLVFTDLALDWSNACALEADGTAWCWGYNSFGQLGDTLLGGTSSSLPRAVTTDLRFQEIGTGGERSCGTDAEKRVWCWGYTTFGTTPLGVAGPVPRAAPGAVAAGIMMRDDNAAFIKSGRPYFWGYFDVNDYLAPGLGSRDPVKLPGGITALTELALSYNTICGRRVDGVVLCWGHVPGVKGPYGLEVTGTPVAIPAP